MYCKKRFKYLKYQIRIYGKFNKLPIEYQNKKINN